MNRSSKLFWSETFKIRAYEVGPTSRATIQSIFNYMQEIPRLRNGKFRAVLNNINSTAKIQTVNVFIK